MSCVDGWRKADLARALGVDAKIIDRLLDLRHSSTVVQLEAELAPGGCRAEIETRELAAARTDGLPHSLLYECLLFPPIADIRMSNL